MDAHLVHLYRFIVLDYEPNIGFINKLNSNEFIKDTFMLTQSLQR